MVHRRQVALSNIHHVNVITHAGAVFGRVIAAEHAQAFTLANSDLRDIRQQVIGNAAGIFTNQPRLMGAYRVEVA
ncbi:hypothetical protein D3C72_1768700 [compost metagenome]